MHDGTRAGRVLSGVYVARLDLFQPHLLGVAKKVRAQVAALAGMPSSIDLVFPSEGAIVCGDQVVKSYGKGPLMRRFAHYAAFYRFATRCALRSDYVYLRYQGASPALLKMLRTIRRKNPECVIIVELPTYPYDREVLDTLRGRLWLLVDKMMRARVFKSVDRIVTFSGNDQIFGVPTIRTQNGADVRAHEPLPPHNPAPEVRLVGIANLSYWHGYDRVISGLGRYYANQGERNVHFDVVGNGRELQNLKDLAKREGVENRVHFHGPLRQDALSDLLAQCHIGISCIALHRKGSDTTDLKSREYCSRGLPFVIGYADQDFPAGFEFAHHIPSDESELDIDAVISFHERLVAKHPHYPTQMHAYAERHLDWKVKMRPVLDALLAIVGQGPGAK